MTGSTCSTCRHFVVIRQPQGQVAMCRRFPPLPIGGAVVTQEGPQVFSQTVWPIVGAGDYCGEHAMAIVLAS
jgi:hypothetical protein